jgi:hypothetical protein
MPVEAYSDILQCLKNTQSQYWDFLVCYVCI